MLNWACISPLSSSTRLPRLSAGMILLGVCLVMAVPAEGQREVEMGIRETGARRMDIILGEFQDERVMGEDRPVFDVIRQDLELSGYFRVLDGLELVRDWLDSTEVRAKWATIGADALLEGKVERSGKDFRLHAYLSDLASGRLVARRTMEGPDPRRIAHSASDEVVKVLTGERGIAATRVAFILDQGTRSELCIADYDGHNMRQLTNTGVLKFGSAWSPDDDVIAFSALIDPSPDLFFWSFPESRMKRITNFPGLVAGASWSRDGKKLALTLTKDGDSEIYIMNRDGSGLRRVTRHPAIDCSPSWAPSGREIAFTSDRSGSPQIYVTDLDGTELRRLTFSGGYNESAAWSPRGDRIAYVAKEAGFFDVWVIDPMGRHRRRITFKGTSNEDPAWAPDGRHLIYVSTRRYQKELVLTDVGGRIEHVLPLGRGDKEEPSWSP
ncbi:Tol-Pal system beta propeller repeat protein TolB [Candidatus Fermentibacteria bacterium]|nr:Tol-Pal system beta propeller repeat protein TolB [Candidatus Fermentibacteria bacterium]